VGVPREARHTHGKIFPRNRLTQLAIVIIGRAFPKDWQRDREAKVKNHAMAQIY